MTKQDIHPYRRIMSEEINEGICACCGNNFPSILIHHLDGDHKNDNKDNLIPLCSYCHGFVHRGFHKRKEMDYGNKERILQIRKILLLEMYKYSLEDANDRIKYERAISSNRGIRKKCLFCGNLTNLRLYSPNFIIKFDKENTRGIGMVICKNCSNNEENTKDLNFVSKISNKSTTFIK